MKTIDKANRLVEKFNAELPIETHYSVVKQIAIECAKIAVDEIIEENNKLFIDGLDFGTYDYKEIGNRGFYWQEVKNELNNMS